jgi:rod shape-determining protein MreC
MRQGAIHTTGTIEHRRSRRLVVVFLLAALLLLVIGPRIQPVASVFSPIFVPVQSVVSGIADDVAGFVGTIARLPQLDGENRTLRKHDAVLSRRLAKYFFYVRENKALTRMLHFQQDLNPRLVVQSARVIGRSTLGLASTVTASAGSDQGVRVGNPVMDENGFVVGKITQVWRSGATVGLISEGADVISIPAVDARTAAAGLVETPAFGQAPRFDNISVGANLRAGDLVATSGLGQGFPTGALIGQITSIHKSNVDPFQFASMRTAANLDNLEYLQIIVNFRPSTTIHYPSSVTQGVTLP